MNIFLKISLSLSLSLSLYIYSGVQVLLGVTLHNVATPNSLLLNSYFKNPTIGLHVLYVLKMCVNFHANRI